MTKSSSSSTSSASGGGAAAAAGRKSITTMIRWIMCIGVLVVGVGTIQVITDAEERAAAQSQIAYISQDVSTLLSVYAAIVDKTKRNKNVDCPTTSNATSTSTTTTTTNDNNNNSNETATTPYPTNQHHEHEWPGIPVEGLGHPLVQKGTNFVNNGQVRDLFLSKYLDEFIEVYRDRHDHVNMCGIRINHAYALFMAVKVLQPQTVIESGVNAGMSTYIIRAAAGPDTRIYPIDPLDRPICGQKHRWIDPNPLTQYYTGRAKFVDFDDIDWSTKIAAGEIDPQHTLVFLDDHLGVFDRFNVIQRHGFRHVVLEDNYKRGEGATPLDAAGLTPKQMMALGPGNADSLYLWHALLSYGEFPPLIPPTVMSSRSTTKRKAAGGFMHYTDTNTDIVAPLLRPDLSSEDRALYLNIAQRLNVTDPTLIENNSYMQLMNYNQIAYFEVVAFSPHLRKRLEKKKQRQQQ